MPATILFMLFLAKVKKRKMITLFEKIYFGESCEPYTTYFLKFRPCYFNNERQRPSQEIVHHRTTFFYLEMIYLDYHILLIVRLC